jgi:electron transport complex protein RnfD
VISSSDPQSLFIVEILTGNYVGYLGMGCAVLILAMWIYQILKGTVRIYAPVAYLVSLIAFFPLISSKYMPGETSVRSILIFILSSGVLYVAVYMLGDFTTMPSRRWGGVAAGILCAAMTTVLLGRVSDMCAILAPVMATNFMSFEIDFFSKTIARKGKMQQREVKVNR